MAVYALSRDIMTYLSPPLPTLNHKRLSKTRMAKGLSLSRVSMSHTASYKFSVKFVLPVLLGCTRFVLLAIMSVC